MSVDLYITRMIRVGGLFIAVHAEVFIHGDRSASLGTATIMMSASFGIEYLLEKLKKGRGGNDDGHAER